MDDIFGFLGFLIFFTCITYLSEILNVCTNHNILFSKYSVHIYYMKIL